jgi:hypothetical protein
VQVRPDTVIRAVLFTMTAPALIGATPSIRDRRLQWRSASAAEAHT